MNRYAHRAVLLTCVMAPAGSAFAQGAVTINRVEVDEAAGQIDIFGTGFGADEPVVTLEGIPVVVVSHTATEIVITMPAGTVPGTYLLTVSQVTPSGPFGGGESSDFHVTVGTEAMARTSTSSRSARPLWGLPRTAPTCGW